MSIDELKALLEAGNITKEQFLAMAKAIDPNYTEEDPETNAGEGGSGEGGDPGTEPDLEKLVQRAVDRATNKLGNENKKLRQQLEALKKSKLTEAEAAELDRQEREEALAERERALQEKENRLYAIKAIQKAGLNDGSDNALELVEFVLGADEAAIDAKVKAFGGLVKKFVKAEVDKTFKQHGRDPGQGGGGAGGNNPWMKESYNITQQMLLENTNPELAKQLKAAAGIK
jgi:hypothetical protein